MTVIGRKRTKRNTPRRKRGRLAIVQAAVAAAEPCHKPGPKPRLDPIDTAIAACMAASGKQAREFLAAYGIPHDGSKLPTGEQAGLMEMLMSNAYKQAMPALRPDRIQEYVACAAKGVEMGVFDGKQASQLLYAAQVCSGAARATAATKKGATR